MFVFPQGGGLVIVTPFVNAAAKALVTELNKWNVMVQSRFTGDSEGDDVGDSDGALVGLFDGEPETLEGASMAQSGFATPLVLFNGLVQVFGTLGHFCNEKPTAVFPVSRLPMSTEVRPNAYPFKAVNEPSYDTKSTTFPSGSTNAIPSGSIPVSVFAPF
jgi:hypothetical protein